MAIPSLIKEARRDPEAWLRLHMAFCFGKETEIPG
jgi:hypothetical protein